MAFNAAEHDVELDRSLARYARQRVLYSALDRAIKGEITPEEFAKEIPQMHKRIESYDHLFDWHDIHAEFSSNELLTPILLKEMLKKYGASLYICPVLHGVVGDTGNGTFALPGMNKSIDVLLEDKDFLEMNKKNGNIIVKSAYLRLMTCWSPLSESMYYIKRDPLGPAQIHYSDEKSRRFGRYEDEDDDYVEDVNVRIMEYLPLYLAAYYYIINHDVILRTPVFEYKGTDAVRYGTQRRNDHDIDHDIEVIKKDIAAIQKRRMDILLPLSRHFPAGVASLISGFDKFGIAEVEHLPPLPSEVRKVKEEEERRTDDKKPNRANGCSVM